jgi:AcrR family transcriptional regulator
MVSARAPRPNNRKALARTNSGGSPSENPGRNKNRREQVLAVAITLFHQRGFSDTSVEDVASAVGLLKGSLYYYINSKQDLLYRIIEDVHVDVERIMDETLHVPDKTALERLENYARMQVEFNARNVYRISVYYHEWERLDPPLLAQVRRKRHRSERAIATLLEEAVSNGELSSDIDVGLAASCVFATIIWPYTWYKPGGKVSPSELASFYARFLLAGIRGAAAPPAPSRSRRAA